MNIKELTNLELNSNLKKFIQLREVTYSNLKFIQLHTPNDKTTINKYYDLIIEYFQLIINLTYEITTRKELEND